MRSIVVAGPSRKMTLTYFPGERPDVTYEFPTGRADPPDFSGSVGANRWQAFRIEIHCAQAQQRLAP
jgi:hypothetical protein